MADLVDDDVADTPVLCSSTSDPFSDVPELSWEDGAASPVRADSWSEMASVRRRSTPVFRVALLSFGRRDTCDDGQHKDAQWIGVNLLWDKRAFSLDRIERR